MTIDQKERITCLIACILHCINRADAIADGVPADEITKRIYIADITESLNDAKSKVDELKQYLIQIDKETL